MDKAGRNEPCPCGSGKKYKQCCMKAARFVSSSTQVDEARINTDFAAAVEHHRAGRLPQAEQRYRQILAQVPRHAGALNGLGLVAFHSGADDFAIDLIANAIGLAPDEPSFYNNLGLPLQNLGRQDEAATVYLKALALQPDYAEAHYNLGNVLRDQGRANDAIASYRAALRFKPDFAEALCNLGGVLRNMGEVNAALASFVAALAVRESPAARGGFVACVRNIRFGENNHELRKLVLRAMVEPWGRPADLAPVSIGLIKTDVEIAGCIARAASTWPARLAGKALFGPAGRGAAANDLMLRGLLENTQVCDLDLERFLTSVRGVMLDTAAAKAAVEDAAENLPAFYCAIARQCFINEYCFDCTDEELSRTQSLRQELVTALESGAAISWLQLAAVAAYFPLHALPLALTLLDRPWIPAVRALLEQQVGQPMQELQYRASIARLTAIDDQVSQAVRRQYEENPFPRWVKLPPAGSAASLNMDLRAQFPFAALQPLDDSNGLEVLVAGCGTGQHSIERARQTARAQILAIDLSLASLSYAMRKTRELGLTNIEYAQADILQLPAIGRSFDLIDAVGVLHHLADPVAGWRVLHSLLRPGGLMRLGFYSAAARRTIAAARVFIAAGGYRATPADIRRCRQELIAAEGGNAFRQLLSSADFFGLSECRDLLFNVEEHSFTLPQIKAAIGELNLNFIGFSLPPEAMRQYGERFPDDKAMTNLDSWHAFEGDHPDTFAGMYQFWVQKT